MFEAIHGSAPRMVEEGRAAFADPASMMRAAVMLLRHIGFVDQASKMEMALDICGLFEKKVILTGRADGATGAQFADYVMETIRNPDLESRWRSYQK
jgi:isocitrate dehydrogenase (NAD+)